MWVLYLKRKKEREREKETRGKVHFTHRARRTKIISDFLLETMQRREWGKNFKALKLKYLPTWNSVSSKIILESEREIKTFSDKIERIVTSRPVFQEMLKGVLWRERT